MMCTHHIFRRPPLHHPPLSLSRHILYSKLPSSTVSVECCSLRSGRRDCGAEGARGSCAFRVRHQTSKTIKRIADYLAFKSFFLLSIPFKRATYKGEPPPQSLRPILFIKSHEKCVRIAIFRLWPRPRWSTIAKQCAMRSHPGPARALPNSSEDHFE